MLELCVRLLAPQQLISFRPDIYVPEAGRGWHLAANLNTTIKTGEGEVHLYKDTNGHRIGVSGALAELCRL